MLTACLHLSILRRSWGGRLEEGWLTALPSPGQPARGCGWWGHQGGDPSPGDPEQPLELELTPPWSRW